MIKLYDLIVKSAEAGLGMQNENGSMPAGTNGPWGDQDTPVRNTSHWLIVFLKSYQHTKDKKFIISARKAADYLISENSITSTGLFFCRKNEKDIFNGLIGQAWPIEALVLASEVLEDEKYVKKALDVFLLHNFNEKQGLWRNNNTFNQQLFFAVAGVMINNQLKNKEIEKRVGIFLKKLKKNISISRLGLILHHIKKQYDVKWEGKIFKKEELSLGYYSFNLYALSILKLKIKPTINYIIPFAKNIGSINNRFAFSYNPTGFELALAIKTFCEDNQENRNLALKLVEKQIKDHYSFEKNLMCKNTVDPITLSARIYEATRLPNLELENGK